MSILLGGGTGFVGRNLLKQLAASNYEVIVVTRKAKEKDEISWSKIETSGIPKGVKAVINLAGYPIATPFAYLTSSFKKKVFDSRIGTNRILAKAIREMKNPPELFLSMSGVGYYPPSTTAVYDENGPNGTDYLGRLSSEWEKATILPSNVPTRVAIVRSGVVLGKNGGLLEVHRAGMPPFFPVFGDGSQYFPWIHVNDMTRLIQFIVENNQLKGVYNGVAPEIAKSAEFWGALRRVKKYNATYNKPLIYLPAFASKSFFGEDISVMLLEGQNVTPHRILKSGFKFQFQDVETAIKDIYAKEN